MIWVLERLSTGFSCPISLETTSYIHIYIYTLGGLLFLCAIQKPLGPIIILYMFGGPSFPSLCYPKTTWTHHHIIYIWGPSFLHTIQKKRHAKAMLFLKHMKISTLAGFMCLPLSFGGPPTTKISKCNSIHVSSRVVKVYMQRGPWHYYYAKHGFIRGQGILRE